MIPLSKPDIQEGEVARVCEVLRSGVLSLGARLREFEDKFAAYTGTRFAVATSSGTAALHLAVRALHIGSGDEVITTSFSFVASTNCLLYERAMPRFIDIDPETLNLDPRAVRAFLEGKCTVAGRQVLDRQTGRRVKAILPVHVFGLPCNMEALSEIATEFHLALIEDACEAIGATYAGRKVGTFGDIGTFAFYPNKQMTTGEGGMIVTDNERIACLCRSMCNQGRDDTVGWLQHSRLGYNYRMSDVHAAIGLAQLERINDLLAAREQVAQRYTESLREERALKLPVSAPQCRRSWFVYPVRVAGDKHFRDDVITRLRANGVGCQAYFPPIHRQSYISELVPQATADLPHTQRAADTSLALPFFSSMTEAQVQEVCEQLDRVLRQPTRISLAA